MFKSTSLNAAQTQLATGEYFFIGDGMRGTESLLGGNTYSPQPGKLRIWHAGQAETKSVELPFFPHSIVAHPEISHRIITFEKWGRQLAEIDFAAETVVRITHAQKGRRFFGHGAHSGGHIYVSQMDDAMGHGMVAVLDGNDHRVMHEFSTQGAYPHDCHLLTDKNTLLVVNSRTYTGHDASRENFSSIVWLDVHTGKCLEQRYVKNGDFGYAHLLPSDDGYFVLSGSSSKEKGNSTPLLAIIRPDGSCQVVDIQALSQERLQGEALSLYINESSGQLFVTLPNAGRVQIWDYRRGELLHQLKMTEPRGLAYCDEIDSLLVSDGKSKKIHLISGKRGETNFVPGVTIVGGNGSHLTRVKL